MFAPKESLKLIDQKCFAGRIGKITKAELSVLCPDISVTTIEKALSDLLKEGYIGAEVVMATLSA